MASTISRSFSFSVLSFVTDELRQTATPVGVVLWGTSEGARVFVASEQDRLVGLKAGDYIFVEVAKRKILNWLKGGALSYADSSMVPNTDAWWRHISKLLIHRVRLSEPRAIDCVDVDKEGQLLFEALVLPNSARQKRRDRIDHELSRTLGGLAEKLKSGSVLGFHGRAVPVKRLKESGKQILIVEGVNLATAAAERDTDALVSKLQRIHETNGGTPGGREIKTYVCYLASPSGLNGEAALVEWINQKASAKTFDLVREQDSFVGEVSKTVEQMEEQSSTSLF